MFSFFIIMLFTCLYVRVDNLFRCGKRLHDRIISPRGQALTHKKSLTPPLFIAVPLPGKENERSCICVLGVSILLHFTTLILELIRGCDIFCLSFYYSMLCFVYHFITACYALFIILLQHVITA